MGLVPREFKGKWRPWVRSGWPQKKVSRPIGGGSAAGGFWRWRWRLDVGDGGWLGDSRSGLASFAPVLSCFADVGGGLDGGSGGLRPLDLDPGDPGGGRRFWVAWGGWPRPRTPVLFSLYLNKSCLLIVCCNFSNDLCSVDFCLINLSSRDYYGVEILPLSLVARAIVETCLFWLLGDAQAIVGTCLIWPLGEDYALTTVEMSLIWSLGKDITRAIVETALSWSLGLVISFNGFLFFNCWIYPIWYADTLRGKKYCKWITSNIVIGFQSQVGDSVLVIYSMSVSCYGLVCLFHSWSLYGDMYLLLLAFDSVMDVV